MTETTRDIDELAHEIVAPTPRRDPFSALRIGDFRLLLAGRFLATLGEQMLGVAIGWELYLRTHSALALGFVGLAEVVPIITLSLPAGYVADRFNRKQVVMYAQVLGAAGALGLALLSAAHGALLLFYLCLLFIGASDAFTSAASSSLVPQTVPPEAFENAATWSSSSWQLAAVLGPALGGLVIALCGGAATLVYGLDLLAIILYLVLLLIMRANRPVALTQETPSLRSMAAGIGFIRQTPIILAAITLDLFAVLLGGATTLLPIFATAILHVGPTGLGVLRAAPSIGAVCMAITLAFRRPFQRAGRTLLVAVAGFGVATIIFGFSRNFWLSLVMLVTLGALDNISVVIRSTLLLLRTPDVLRGRISAVNNIFIGASNQLGGFESGVTAALLGPVVSVGLGGVGTLVVVGAVAIIWPQMRRLGTLRPDITAP
ncbi:MAG: MFS transporter [Ktedonobacteraceae bacterium]|nr:MFS transporter [Ktedonobacteraceae bacterium]MBA3822482.1 MFS transporter [Ktedonobacterales bacterium]